nr:sulfurtransferase-like selenium metabolism protein YedF [Deltaproteobacteria bacterium]
MATIVDARGRACPEPVMLTLKALGESNEVTTIVDAVEARENVSRLARTQGFRVDIEEKDGAWHLHLVRETSGTVPETQKMTTGPTVLLIGSECFGRGSDELGKLLMRTFLHTLGESPVVPEQIIFLNSGVKLVADDSAVLEDLEVLAKRGVDLCACGTCLGFYELKDRVATGRISNMYDIASALLNAGRTIEI